MKDIDLVKKFDNGPILICRLCPVDYHYFHYPDSGEFISAFDIEGGYDSVNIMSLFYHQETFCRNYRRVNLLKSNNFGELLFIEVGAMCVGKINQTHKEKVFKRGELKGHFSFGASTLIVIGQKGSFIPSTDLIHNSLKGLETKVKLGDVIGLHS